MQIKNWDKMYKGAWKADDKGSYVWVHKPLIGKKYILERGKKISSMPITRIPIFEKKTDRVFKLRKNAKKSAIRFMRKHPDY